MTQNTPAEWAMKAAVAAFDQPLPTDSIMLSVARAIEVAANVATERAACVIDAEIAGYKAWNLKYPDEYVAASLASIAALSSAAAAIRKGRR